MAELLEIKDDFDLEKIARSGQCFRVRHLGDGIWRFVTREHVLYIKEAENRRFSVSCTSKEWNRVWSRYFDFGRSYAEIVKRAAGLHPFIDEAMDFSRGLRVLRQDPWETLVSFIISQRKTIPAIMKSVEAMAGRYGTPVETEYETLCLFPSVEALVLASAEDLAACGLGYRTPYVMDAVQKVASGKPDLNELEKNSDDELLSALMTIRGVGIKVARCTALFGYGRMASVPIDVWISRAIEECGGESPFGLFGEDAGIIQQYVFNYMIHGKDRNKAD